MERRLLACWLRAAFDPSRTLAKPGMPKHAKKSHRALRSNLDDVRTAQTVRRSNERLTASAAQTPAVPTAL